MRFPFAKVPLKWPAFFSAVILALAVLAIGYSQLNRQKQEEFYKIGIIINSVEISPEDLAVVQFIIGKKVAEINKAGGIGGKLIEAVYLDDKGSDSLLFTLVKQTAEKQNFIAYIGCKSSLRASAIAPYVGKHRIPFIGGFSLTSVNAPYPTIYSMDVGMTEVAVVLQNLLRKRATKAAFIGKPGDLYSDALLQIMDDYKKQQPGFNVVLKQRFRINHHFTSAEFRMLADSIKHSKADFLLLSTEQEATNRILNGLWNEGLRMPVFTGLADLSQVKTSLQGYSAGELYDVGVLGIPGVLNTRLQQIIDRYKKELPQTRNLEFRVAYGGRLSDAMGLITEAARQQPDTGHVPIRERINLGLKHYINGNQIYSGWFADCFFTKDRTFGGEELLAWKPPNNTRYILAPFQFLRKNDSLEPASVVYLNLDLVQISQGNSEPQNFDARFYLELTSAADLSLDDLDFANAARNTLNHEPLIEAKLLRRDTHVRGSKFYNYLYRVSGKFTFSPDLKTYPFDEQKFPITIHTGKSEHNLLVQPPSQNLRDIVFESPGWAYRHNYVGYDQEIIATDTSFSSLQKNIPLYKYNLVYVLKRARVDFNLKTLVPLMAILVISYFSVYIPQREFEAMAAIQVTALLSAIALYFATAKPESQFATISDKIFIFSYLMITSLLGTSILIYVLYHRQSRIKALAHIYQRYLFPVVVIGFTLYLRS